MENKTVYTYGSGDMGTYECADMGAYECTEVKESTLENVIAARKAADNAEKKCTKMAAYVAEMQGARDFYANQLMICKEEEKAEAEKNFLVYNKLLSDAHTEWTSALESQAELWEAYNISLDEYRKESAMRSLCADFHATYGDRPLTFLAKE